MSLNAHWCRKWCVPTRMIALINLELLLATEPRNFELFGSYSGFSRPWFWLPDTLEVQKGGWRVLTLTPKQPGDVSPNISIIGILVYLASLQNSMIEWWKYWQSSKSGYAAGVASVGLPSLLEIAVFSFRSGDPRFFTACYTSFVESIVSLWSWPGVDILIYLLKQFFRFSSPATRQ